MVRHTRSPGYAQMRNAPGVVPAPRVTARAMGDAP